MENAYTSSGPMGIRSSLGSRIGIPLLGVPAERRIGGSYATLFYVGGTLMDFSLITTAMGAISSAIDIGKTAIAVRDDSKASEVVGAMNEKLLNAQQRLFELSAAIGSLQQENFQAAQELRELREALAERGRYSLFALGDRQFAYRVNPTPALSGAVDPGLAEPEHYICQQCFDGPTKAKVVLKFFPAGPGSDAYWVCPSCRDSIALFGTELPFSRPSQAIMD